DRAPSGELREHLKGARASAARSGWNWLAAQLAALDAPTPDARPPLAEWFTARPAWEAAIGALAELAREGAQAKATRGDGHSRLRIAINLGDRRGGEAAFVTV